MTKIDLHQAVTDKIIAAMEAGAGAWEMPWIKSATGGLPINAVTGRAYSGVNVLTLWLAGGTQKWATYKQWQSVGAQVAKGQKGQTIVFFSPWIVPEHKRKDGDNGKRLILKASTVFSADQVEGWVDPEASKAPVSLVARDAAVEAFADATGAMISWAGDRACYVPSRDIICMPDRDKFTSKEGLYSTLLHELVHWTGAKGRADRDLSGRFGSNSYAFEELVAELGAAFLCAELGVTNEPRQDHAAYLASWLKVLKDDKKAIFNAASLASKAVAFLHEAGADHDELEEAEGEGDGMAMAA